MINTTIITLSTLLALSSFVYGQATVSSTSTVSTVDAPDSVAYVSRPNTFEKKNTFQGDVEVRKVTEPGAGLVQIAADVQVDSSLTVHSSEAAKPVITIENNGDAIGDGSFLKLYRNDPNPSTGHTHGKILFEANNSVGTRTTFVDIIGQASSLTNGSENGVFTLRLKKNGTLKNLFDFSSTTMRFNSLAENIDIRFENAGDDSALFIDGADGGILSGPGLTSQGAGTINVSGGFYTNGTLLEGLTDSLNIDSGQFFYSPTFDFFGVGVGGSVVDADPLVVFRQSGSTLPGIGNESVLVLQNNSSTATQAALSIISGTAADAEVRFGDSGSQEAGSITWSNNAGSMTINAGANDASLTSNGVWKVGFGLNETVSGTVNTENGYYDDGSFVIRDDSLRLDNGRFVYFPTFNRLNVGNSSDAASGLQIINDTNSINFVGIKPNTYQSGQKEMWVNASLDCLFVRLTGNAFFAQLTDLGGTH